MCLGASSNRLFKEGIPTYKTFFYPIDYLDLSDIVHVCMVGVMVDETPLLQQKRVFPFCTGKLKYLV